MYINNKFSEANSALIKSVLSLFLFFNFAFIHGQTWEFNISKDYELSIKDVWGESENYIAKFVVYNSKTAFVKELEIKGDESGIVLFPDEFIQTRGKFNNDTISNFDWYIEVRKKRVKSGKLIYDPSPNKSLQLFAYDPKDFSKKELLWGDIIDSYQWEDNFGQNVFIRTKSVDTNSLNAHLYFYHFISDSINFHLIRKFTDYVKNCNSIIVAEHNIESIELTDIDQDTVAELSFKYSVDCLNGSDSTNVLSKLFLTTKGEKYAIRSSIPTKKNSATYKIGGNLKKKILYRRFLERKWKEEESE